MQRVTINIDIPKGYKFKRIGFPEYGELIITETANGVLVDESGHYVTTMCLIVEDE